MCLRGVRQKLKVFCDSWLGQSVSEIIRNDNVHLNPPLQQQTENGRKCTLLYFLLLLLFPMYVNKHCYSQFYCTLRIFTLAKTLQAKISYEAKQKAILFLYLP